MSTTVVPAAADQTERSARSDKPAAKADKQQPANEQEAPLAGDDSDAEVGAAAKKVEKSAEGEAEVTSETSPQASLDDDFSFGGALADAAASSGFMIAEADAADENGFAQAGGGTGGTILLIGAVALVGLGIAVLVDGGDNDDDNNLVNTSPTFAQASQALTVAEDGSVQGTATATDADGDPITYTASSPANGTVTFGTGGAFTYTPNADFNGTDTFTITASDGRGGQATQTVTVTVTPADDGPTIVIGEIAAIDEDSEEGATFTVDAGEGATLVVTAENGTVTDNGDGTYTFIPAPDFNGDAQITVVATDAGGLSSTATDTVVVNSVNDAAVLSPLTLSVNEDTPTNLSDLLQVTDVDGDASVVEVVVSTQPQHGTIEITEAGDVIYTPNEDYSGSDTVSFTLTDDEGLAATYTVTLNVVPDNPTQSLDVGTANVTTEIDAANGNFIFTDNAASTTNVNIVNFEEGDSIVVTNAIASDYNFGRDFNDINDLIVSYTDPVSGASNTYVIQDVLPDTGPVNSYQSAINAIGFDFMTFA